MTEHTFSSDRYARMPYRRCGRSGLVLPAVSLGFWQGLGSPGKEELCRQCCYWAFDQGVTHFDLANNYGPPPGSSETVVGQILKHMPRDELIISTKAGYEMWAGPYGDGGSKKYLVASLDASLKRLGLDYVDIFYHHRFDPDTPQEETLAALDLVVKQGKALYAGVSNYDGARTRQACEIVRRHDWTPITIHQPRINLLERRFVNDLLPTTQEHGVGVIAFSPLAQGRLSEKYMGGLPADSRIGQSGRGQEWYDKEQQAGTWKRVGALAAIARRRGQTLPQMSLAWLLADQRITSVLIGVSRLDQLKECLAAPANTSFSAEETAAIEEAME